MGWSLHLVHHTRDTTCVENYWFCEVILQGERVVNYQLARPIEFRTIRIIRIGPTRKYYDSKIRVEVLVLFHLRFERFLVLAYSKKIQTRGFEDVEFPGVSKK